MGLRVAQILAMSFFPGWYWFTLSSSGKVLLSALALVGLGSGLLIARHHARADAALRRWSMFLFFLAGVAGHLLTLWLLAVDPKRDIPGVPLPWPFGELASTINLLLYLGGPLYVGFVASGWFQVLRSRKLDGMTVFSTIIVLYLAWITPWIGHVVWD